MSEPIQLQSVKDPSLARAIDRASRAIPPMWPLSATVAVNPFLGQSDETLAAAGARLARVAGAPITPDRTRLAAKIDAGTIQDADILAALEAAAETPDGAGAKPLTAAEIKAAARRGAAAPVPPIPTLASLAATASGRDWPGIVAERVGAWAAGYFDEGQALWTAPRGKTAWGAWRATATHDLAPEILGLDGFASAVEDAPDTAALFIAQTVDRLGLPAEAQETYFHQLLLSLGGWAQLARQRLFVAERGGGTDATLTDLLAIRLFWERALFRQYEAAVAADWATARTAHAAPLAVSRDLLIDTTLQEAAERAAQRAIGERLAAPAPAASIERPALQAAFCIDVRSEVIRRALEALDPRIETLGFAGFFGLGASHRRFASDVEEHRLPVLLEPGIKTCAGGHDHAEAETAKRISLRAGRAWGRFKLAAVSSFAFVEAAGPIYVGKLVRDALGLGDKLSAKKTEPDPAPRLDPALDLETRIGAAQAVLRAMSLTEGFARLVLMVGHGARVVNNPFQSALQCGACGGHSGETNARLLAGLLNDADVRAGLAAAGIEIPADTLFLGALHDTTTDEIALFDGDHDAAAHADDLAAARDWFAAAAKVARGERADKLPGARPGAAGERDVAARGRDWAEVRPEWALAGCQAFIAAPRGRTVGRDFGGRVFLHSYNWRQDDQFKTLELILTAPVVVASWISLQYYGSTVAPDVFGAGDKLLHNVVGGIGVIEGNGGVLRAGLPWQSVHDGDDFVHEPLRLSVCVEAPTEAMTDILRRHEGVRTLFDNRWMHLFAMDEAGGLATRYTGDLTWSDRTAPTAQPAAIVPNRLAAS